jgi:hypothetical protein
MIITFVLAVIITVIIIFGVCKISLLNKTGTAAVNANQYGNRSVST